MRDARSEPATAAWVAALIVLAFPACGGKSNPAPASNALPAAGTQTLVKTLTVADSGGSLDDGQGISLTVPAGAMSSGSVVKLVEWSEQRAVAQIPTFTTTAKAIDIVVAPSLFVGGGQMTLNLPWSASGDPIGTVFTAFGPAGTPLVLIQTPASTQAAPQATLGAAQMAFLGGVDASSTTPIEIEIAIEQIPLQMPDPASKAMARMRTVWSAPPRRDFAVPHPRSPDTNYADKTRVAVTIHGVMNTVDDVADLTNFLQAKTTEDGDSSSETYPFDLVNSFEYDYRDTIENNGVLFASYINSQWGDPTKYEVHIFGHSMGGIVARWAVEQVGTPSVTQLVTLGSPSKGVPIEEMRQVFVLTQIEFGALNPVDILSGIAAVFAPGPKELCQGSALLATLSTSTVPQGVAFQAIGGTFPDLPTAYYTIAAATLAIVVAENRLPYDGFVPLDSALGNFATSKLDVPYNHSDLVDKIVSYWPGSTAATWIDGINRKIADLLLPYAKISLNPQGTQTIAAIAHDKDGDQLDPGLLFDASLPNGANPQLQWTAADPTMVSFSGEDQLSVTLTALKAGSTTVTVTDPASGVSGDVPVQVGPGNILITPPNQLVNEGAHQTFTVGLVVGTVPDGATANWTLTGNGTIDGAQTVTSTSLTVDYLAPSTPETDTLAVELKDASGTSLGAISTPINVGFDSIIMPQNPHIVFSEEVTFTISAANGAELPAGATYKWTATPSAAEVGNPGSGDSTSTTAPSLDYTAPSAQSGVYILQVQVVAANGAIASTAMTTVDFGATIQWQASIPFVVPGPYNDPQLGPLPVLPANQSKLIQCLYQLSEAGLFPDGSDTGFQLTLNVPATGFAPGQMFLAGTSAIGTFGFDFCSANGGNGTLTIGSVTSGANGVTVVPFTFECSAPIGQNIETTSGSGSFAVTLE